MPGDRADERRQHGVVERLAIPPAHKVRAEPLEDVIQRPDASPLAPVDLRIEYSIVPNQFVRVVDPRLTVNSFDPELLKALGETPRFTMFGPGFTYRRLPTAEGLWMWLFHLWGQLDIVAFACPPALAVQMEKAIGVSG